MSGVSGVGPRPGDVEDLTAAEVTAAPEAHAVASDLAAERSATVAAPTARPAAPSATRFLDQVAVGKLPDGTEVRFDPASGRFSARSPSGAETTGARALYQAAQLVAEGNVAFLSDPGLGATGRMKLAQTLQSAIAQNEGSTPPKLADLQARSGAATLALAFMKQLPEGDPLKARLLDAYLRQLAIEPEKGLKATSALNLEEAHKNGKVRLSAAQQAGLVAAKEATLPSRPPYESWFKDGKTDLNVKQYIHPEFYDAMLSGYKKNGFKTDADLGDGHLKMSKTYTDPASGRTMKVNVEVIKTYAEGHKPEKRLFNDMSDPNTDIEFYTGHSNLGGNVLGALAAGPKEQNGDKWVINWMCRGKQVLADVYNRFPNAHYTTTTDPAYVMHSDKFTNGLFQGIVERKSYAEIWEKMGSMPVWWKGTDLKNWFMRPDDPRILQVRDLDRDGRVDLSRLSGLDPLYNVGQSEVTESAERFKPVATDVNPQDVPGDKVMRGVNFLNTILTYHLDEEDHPGGNDGRLPKDVGDKIFAGGWFKSQSDEIVRVEERKVGEETVYEVKVNTKYKDQDVDALGAAIAYEVNKYLSVKKNGQYTEQDKLRGALLAGEYMAYMCESYEEVSGLTAAMARKYGFNEKLTWENLIGSIEADRHGYCSPDATKELKRRIGSADPRIG